MTGRPQYPEPCPPQPDQREKWVARILALGLVGATAVLAPLTLIRAGRVDSAALFVGVPLVIAIVVVLAPAAKSLHGLTFRVITFGLLITSAFLHEGAACVLMAAPLVYAVGHFMAQLIQMGTRSDHRHRSALLAVPVLALACLEGTVPSLRAVPEQTVGQERVVAASPAEVERRLAEGPRFDTAERTRLLRISGYPTPTAAHGPGLAGGSRWTFTMAGGPIVTEVTERAPGRVVFAVVSDSSKTQRWLTWRGGSVSWHATPAGTAVRVEAKFVRRLDPSWYFGPIESAMVGSGLEHFTDSLGLDQVGGHGS